MSLSFSDLKLQSPLLTALAAAGYEQPTPVQLESIPAALANHDLMVSAQTGSGKTAAFLLPTLQKMIKRSEKPGKGPRALVLTPTRELAQQVEKNAQIYGKNMPWLRSVTLVGGTSFGQQIRALSRPIDLIVATPGRLMDHMRQGRIDFSRLEVLILDEADRMLDMGFIDDIETIVAATPAERQTLLFSATWDGMVGKLAQKLTNQPEKIDIAREEKQGKIDEQLLYCDDSRHKNRLLDFILRDTSIDQAVIFTATKAMSEQLADRLYENGFSANCLHGDMPQGWRNRTLMDLRKGRIKILVATDVAARGIDVPTITHVINYDLPKQAEDYVHRIGRTGRAGRTGLAITFAEVNEYVKVHKIERYLNRKLPEQTIDGMEPTRKRVSKPTGRGRRSFNNNSNNPKNGNWNNGNRRNNSTGSGQKHRPNQQNQANRSRSSSPRSVSSQAKH